MPKVNLLDDDGKENSRVKYLTAVNLRISEGEIQWSRYNAILIVNTIFITLLGLVYSVNFKLPHFKKELQLIAPILGLVLCYLWHRVSKRGFKWIEFWMSKARKLEVYLKDRSEINPITLGNEFRSSNKVIINTELASFYIIIIFSLIYIFFLLVAIKS